jgi:hypothetical protein
MTDVFGIEVGSTAWYLLTFGGGLALGLGVAAVRAWWRRRRR